MLPPQNVSIISYTLVKTSWRHRPELQRCLSFLSVCLVLSMWLLVFSAKWGFVAWIHYSGNPLKCTATLTGCLSQNCKTIHVRQTIKSIWEKRDLRFESTLAESQHTGRCDSQHRPQLDLFMDPPSPPVSNLLPFHLRTSSLKPPVPTD